MVAGLGLGMATSIRRGQQKPFTLKRLWSKKAASTEEPGGGLGCH